MDEFVDLGVSFFDEGFTLDPYPYLEELYLIFGGSVYVCIGRELGLAFLERMVEGFVEHLPEGARVVEDEIEVDGDWVAERIITRMPLELGAPAGAGSPRR